jgi:fructose-1,6-bisphosphatase/inositol monophosphatase family enzyme
MMIEEAGGRCEELDGGEVNLGPGFSNVLGSNGAIHDDLFDLLQRTDRATQQR